MYIVSCVYLHKYPFLLITYISKTDLLFWCYQTVKNCIDTSRLNYAYVVFNIPTCMGLAHNQIWSMNIKTELMIIEIQEDGINVGHHLCNVVPIRWFVSKRKVGCILSLVFIYLNNRFLRESLLKIWDFFHECEKSQIFNQDECKYLFLPFQLKNKACRFHSFIITTPRAMK